MLVTNGSMQADAFLFDALVQPGDAVVVEKPTYDRTLLGLKQRGAEIHMVELEPDGIDVAAPARRCSRAACGRSSRTSSPTSRTRPATRCSREKRVELLALATEYGFTIFEDDPYIEIRFTGHPLPTMLSLDGKAAEHVVYASSFSKTVCPGIRVGYLIGPEELIATIARNATNTYISPNMVAQSIVYQFCASGRINDAVKTVSAALAARVEALTGALAEHLPGRALPGARGRLLHVGRAARGHRRARAVREGRPSTT